MWPFSTWDWRAAPTWAGKVALVTGGARARARCAATSSTLHS